jgi:hypothetical protein
MPKRSLSLLVASLFLLQASITVLSQSITRETRIRWEKLVYEDAKALIQETTQELAKNPKNGSALRMRSSGFYINSDPEKGKADAVAALALLNSPTNAEEFEAKCYAERRLEKYDEALSDCTKAIEWTQSLHGHTTIAAGLTNLRSRTHRLPTTQRLSMNSVFATYSSRGYLFSRR